MAWFSGKVSLGGFPDLAGAVNKLQESVKNIEKNFDTALGYEEKSESSSNEGIFYFFYIAHIVCILCNLYVFECNFLVYTSVYHEFCIKILGSFWWIGLLLLSVEEALCKLFGHLSYSC